MGLALTIHETHLCPTTICNGKTQNPHVEGWWNRSRWDLVPAKMGEAQHKLRKKWNLYMGIFSFSLFLIVWGYVLWATGPSMGLGQDELAPDFWCSLRANGILSRKWACLYLICRQLVNCNLSIFQACKKRTYGCLLEYAATLQSKTTDSQARVYHLNILLNAVFLES